MMTYGGGSIFQSGVYAQGKAALAGHQLHEFGGIEPNPEYETLMRCVEECKVKGIDYLLAVGGGSVIDGTKFIATAMLWEGDCPWDFLAEPLPTGKAIPLAAVLTIPATGSEMNSGSVVSRRAIKEKRFFFNEACFPQFSILDPTAIYSLPAHQIANGIVDSFIHTVEQYLTYEQQANVQDYWAEGILKTLIGLAPKLQENQQDYDTCANFMYAATMALNGFIVMGVTPDWATHMIGQELTALHGLDHGLTLAIVYPGVLQVMREGKREKLLRYAANVWGITTGSEDERIDAAIAATEEFFRSLGLKTRLNEHGIGEDTITEITARFAKQGYPLGERGDITASVVEQILKQVQ